MRSRLLIGPKCGILVLVYVNAIYHRNFRPVSNTQQNPTFKNASQLGAALLEGVLVCINSGTLRNFAIIGFILV